VSLYSILTCGSVIAELIASRAIDRSSPTTMGMCGVSGSTGVMVVVIDRPRSARLTYRLGRASPPEFGEHLREGSALVVASSRGLQTR
jgi:hypothetical protein